mgnify:CR=1 FL=1
MAHVEQSELPVISDLNEFDYDSGTFLEKLVFKSGNDSFNVNKYDSVNQIVMIRDEKRKV